MHEIYPEISAICISATIGGNNRWNPLSTALLCIGIDIAIRYIGGSI